MVNVNGWNVKYYNKCRKPDILVHYMLIMNVCMCVLPFQLQFDTLEISLYIVGDIHFTYETQHNQFYQSPINQSI